jgi:hypothetical protein
MGGGGGAAPKRTTEMVVCDGFGVGNRVCMCEQGDLQTRWRKRGWVRIPGGRQAGASNSTKKHGRSHIHEQQAGHRLFPLPPPPHTHTSPNFQATHPTVRPWTHGVRARKRLARAIMGSNMNPQLEGVPADQPASATLEGMRVFGMLLQVVHARESSTTALHAARKCGLHCRTKQVRHKNGGGGEEWGGGDAR